MKILLYFEGKRILAKSGIGRALEHQKRALAAAGIEYTLDPNCIDYDILHINTYGIGSYRMIAKARRMGKKVIYHTHSTEEDFRNSFIGSNQVAPLFKRYLISHYSKADCLITPTVYSKEILEGYGMKQPIAAISNGIDLEKYRPDTRKETLFREYFKLAPEQKVVICVGLFFKRKGLIDFVEIAKSMPDYTFIWFGHVNMLSIPKEIREIVKKKHPDNVLFPGYIKGEIIEGAYSGADLFFFPSYEETEGIVVLEALASKQKVLTRDIPVYHDWLESGINCYMASDNAGFKQHIQKIVDKQLPDTVERGYQTAVRRSISEIGQELKLVYEQVLDESYVKI
ncbi:glycosyltransferase [Enterococcus sp. LJL51]|uniref:glycosyltransferase n=1 Tax=Enterococcus sp. LJL51 TaxID=3416656 RepID=UPI003CF80384